jgi:hypothetical protein
MAVQQIVLTNLQRLAKVTIRGEGMVSVVVEAGHDAFSTGRVELVDPPESLVIDCKDAAKPRRPDGSPGSHQGEDFDDD